MLCLSPVSASGSKYEAVRLAIEGAMFVALVVGWVSYTELKQDRDSIRANLSAALEIRKQDSEISKKDGNSGKEPGESRENVTTSKPKIQETSKLKNQETEVVFDGPWKGGYLLREQDVYKKPDKNAPIIRHWDAGTKFLYRKIKGNSAWFRVSDANGNFGYVLSNRVEDISDANASPTYNQNTSEKLAPKTDFVGTYADTGGHHWISRVADDGGLIELEDKSNWRVDEVDRIDSALWLPTEDILVVESGSGYKLINKDTGESVHVSYLGP